MANVWPSDLDDSFQSSAHVSSKDVPRSEHPQEICLDLAAWRTIWNFGNEIRIMLMTLLRLKPYQ